jgi:hypothetical protein
MNSVLIEFEDGQRGVASRYAIRRVRYRSAEHDEGGAA